MKTVPDALSTAENESESTNHENGTRRPRTAENEYGRPKPRKWDPTPSVPPETSPGAQIVKTGPDALGTAETESGSVKHEKGTLGPRYRRKRIRV
jgi:hypothetical protein